MTPNAPQSGAATTSLPVAAPDTSRTGWESVSRMFEEIALNSREVAR